MKAIVKRVLLAAPGFESVCRRLTRDHVRALFYHRFSEEPDPAARCLSRDVLRQQLAIITRHHTTWTPDQQISSLMTGRIVDRCPVVITIDDGYWDTYEVAFPLFREFGVEPTVYVAAGYIEGTTWYWWDQLRHLLNQSKQSRITLEVEGHQLACDLTDGGGLELAWNRIADILVAGPSESIKPELERIGASLGASLPAKSPPEYRPITHDQLSEMEQHGMTFGAHTVTHPVLSRISPEQARKEIVGSYAHIQERVRNSSKVFCYPHGGRKDFTPETHQIVRESGFRAAYLAVAPAPDPLDRYGLPRYFATQDLQDFRWKLCGAERLSARIRDRLRGKTPARDSIQKAMRDWITEPARSTPAVTATPRATPATVGIVITCYNYGRFLGVCLESVLAQTFGDFEAVVVDDGSTDDTPELIRPWLQDPRIRYVRQANQGQAAAKNRGIRECRTEYIAFLDADDLWEPAKLEKQLALFANERLGVAFTLGHRIDESGAGLPDPHRDHHMLPKRGRVTSELIYDNFVPFSSSMVRRICLEETGGFKEYLPMAIDWDLWLRISGKWDFDYVDEPLFRYRIGHGDQMSRKMKVRQRCCDQIMAEFLEDHPDIVKRQDLRQAKAYTHGLRGRYYEEHDRLRALHHYFMSMLSSPLRPNPYLGILRTLFPFLKTMKDRLR